MEKITKQIDITDKDHLWMDGQQYISLNRLYEIRKELNKELKIANKKIKELTEENNALKVLLKKQLNGEDE